MPETEIYLPRILVVDDEPHILETYGNILGSDSTDDPESLEFQGLHKAIFEEDITPPHETSFDLVYAQQGKDAVKKVREARDAGDPFAVIFLDMRMPPGQGGLLTAKQIRIIDKRSNIVIVTAYSDVEPSKLSEAIQPADKLFYLRKPFYPQEIQQFAIGLIAKWQAEARLDAIIEEQSDKLARTNIAFHEVIDEQKKMQEKLHEKTALLTAKERDSVAIRQAVDALFRKKFDVCKEFENNILFNIKQRVFPYFKKIRESDTKEKRNKILGIVESNLQNIISPFVKNLSLQNFQLSPDELHIANLISLGKKSKEIGAILDMDKRKVEYHRYQIRKKIGLKNTSKTLKDSLLEMGAGK